MARRVVERVLDDAGVEPLGLDSTAAHVGGDLVGGETGHPGFDLAMEVGVAARWDVDTPEMHIGLGEHLDVGGAAYVQEIKGSTNTGDAGSARLGSGVAVGIGGPGSVLFLEPLGVFAVG